MKLQIVLIAIMVSMFFATSRAFGEFIPSLTVSVEQQAGGLFRYEYTLSNAPESDFRAVVFVLDDVSEVADIQSASGPKNWDYAFEPSDPTSVGWAAQEPFFEHGIPSGSNSRFSFISPLGPALRHYFIDGTNSGETSLTRGEGEISVPGAAVAVPEPSSLILGILGGLPIVSWYFWPSVRRVLGKSRPPASPLSLKAQSVQPHRA